MKTYQLEILEPKAKKLLEALVNLKLIRMHEVSDQSQEFKLLLSKLRGRKSSKPTVREIKREVEIVRTKRYRNN